MNAPLEPGCQPEEDESVTRLKEAMVAYAKESLEDEGVLEFDDSPETSIAFLEDPGAGLGGYIACWHWVSLEEMGWDRCNNCGVIEERNGDWYDGECPSCADASEPEEADVDQEKIDAKTDDAVHAAMKALGLEVEEHSDFADLLNDAISAVLDNYSIKHEIT